MEEEFRSYFPPQPQLRLPQHDRPLQNLDDYHSRLQSQCENLQLPHDVTFRLLFCRSCKRAMQPYSFFSPVLDQIRGLRRVLLRHQDHQPDSQRPATEWLLQIPNNPAQTDLMSVAPSFQDATTCPT